jgi:hypothetical protein
MYAGPKLGNRHIPNRERQKQPMRPGVLLLDDWQGFQEP